MLNKYANWVLHSDVNPFEIVKVISDKTILIREMDSEELAWKKDVHVGGFSAHVSNQHEQKWDIKSNPNNKTIRCRKHKNGTWHSAFGSHSIDDNPIKFRDYNF